MTNPSLRAARRGLALLTVCLLTACATPMTKGSHCVVDPGYLDAQTTFSWHTEPPITLADETGYISPAMLSLLENALIEELRRKGLNYVDPTVSGMQSDVTIAINLRTRRELHSIDVTESPCRHTDCWERIDMGSNTRMDIRTAGFLTADVYDKDKPIWRGWVERWLYPNDRDNAGAVIGAAIPALFESFPP